MRCVTLNSWKNEGDYHARLIAMTAGLAALNVDVIALQECFVADALGLDTSATLGHALNMYVTRSPMRAKPRSHGGLLVDSRSDLAILSRMPPLAIGLASFPDESRDTDRGLLWVDVDLGATALRVGCTHLTHLRDAAGEILRTRQAAAAVEQLLAGWSGPAVLMGDLNAVARDPSMAPVFANLALDPNCLAAAQACGDIDHVLLFQGNPSFTLTSRSVTLHPDRVRPALGPSDHPAVVADFAVAMPAHDILP